jgi:hypothetical protein
VSATVTTTTQKKTACSPAVPIPATQKAFATTTQVCVNAIQDMLELIAHLLKVNRNRILKT